MKTLKIISMVVLAIIVIQAIVIAMQPEKAHIEKSIVINAPADSIFPEVSNYRNFSTWSPWTKMDPEVKQSFDETQASVGSTMSWDGPKTGKGLMKVEEIEENKRVKSSMTFGGYNGKFYSEFILTPEENGTRVTWTYEGHNAGLTGKAMWVVIGSMLSSQYDQGLKDLKDLVEHRAATNFDKHIQGFLFLRQHIYFVDECNPQ
jgi:uncharacterized protein YndB with AHSA1/START domain